MNAFDKVIGYDDVKTELERFCDVLKNSARYEKLGVTLPSGILFLGDPGIGKTMMARSFIEETGWKSYVIRRDKPDGDFTNQIRETFEKAGKEGRCIILLDDMDKFANADEKHPDAEEYVAVQACIDDSRDKGVFVLATINETASLPKSLLRTGRFDKITEMSTPGFKDVVKITSHFLSQRKTAKDVDAKEIAAILAGLPISDIKVAINDAGINAGFEGRARINRDDILKAIKRLLFDSPECVGGEHEGSEMVPVHEMGHALVAEMLEPGSVSFVSIEPHNAGVGGVTRIRSKKDVLDSKTIENQAIWALGGRAATEICFGKPDAGSNSDITKAYKALRNLISYEATDNFESFHRLVSYGGLSDDRQGIVIAHEMEKCYQKAKTIIAENGALFNTLLDLLKEKQTLTYKDIRAVIDSFIIIPKEIGEEVKKMLA